MSEAMITITTEATTAACAATRERPGSGARRSATTPTPSAMSESRITQGPVKPPANDRPQATSARRSTSREGTDPDVAGETHAA